MTIKDCIEEIAFIRKPRHITAEEMEEGWKTVFKKKDNNEGSNMSQIERVKKSYDERAETYDAYFEKNVYKIFDAITWKYLEPYLPKNKDAVILDAAGGTGRWSIPMAKKGLNVVLVDISNGMLNVARTKIKEAGLEEKITVEQEDITKLEYPDETFDLVLCEHALVFIEDKSRAIQELARVLKKGSPIIVSIPNIYTDILMSAKHDFPQYIDMAIRTMNGSLTTIAKDDERKLKGLEAQSLTPIEFRKILEENGLEVKKIIGKVVTMHGMPEIFINEENMPKDLLKKLLQIEVGLCEREDALGLAAHLQAVAYKKCQPQK